VIIIVGVILLLRARKKLKDLEGFMAIVRAEKGEDDALDEQ